MELLIHMAPPVIWSKSASFGLLKGRKARDDSPEKKVKVSRGVAKKYGEYS
ncbi:hypothetical protein KKHLCK_08245 [Candidatus Electrothrix laxa]